MRTVNWIVKVFLEQLTHLGGLVFYCIWLGLLLVAGQIQIFTGLLVSLIMVMGLGVIIRIIHFRNRPKPQRHANWLEKLDAASFPSLHAMRAVSLAFWGSLMLNSIVGTVYLFLLALLVIASRVILKKHFISDVFWGAVFSLIINLIVWWLV